MQPDGDDNSNNNQCQYKGKVCLNRRHVLPSGVQVKLCKDHRNLANYNQRSYHERRRSDSQQREAGSDSNDSPNTRDIQNIENMTADDYLALAERMRREDEERQRTSR